jgi:hypothetical protein
LIPIKQHSQPLLQAIDHHRSRPLPKSCRYQNLTASGQCRRNLISPNSGNRIPAIWPNRPDLDWLARSSQNARPVRSGQKIPARTAGSLLTSQDLARTAGFWPTAGFQRFWRILASMPESGRSVPEFGSFGRNSANPDSNETVRIPAFILDSGYSSRNGGIR